MRRGRARARAGRFFRAAPAVAGRAGRPGGGCPPEGAQDDDGGRRYDGGRKPGGVGAGVYGARELGDQASQDGGHAHAQVAGGKERGHDGGAVPGLGEPVELGQAAAEDEPDGDAAGDGACQEQPQRLGVQRRFQGGEADQQQWQPGAHAAAGWQPRGGRLADCCCDEDQAGCRPDEGEVVHTEDAVQESGHQAAEEPQGAERGEPAQARPQHDGPHARRGGEAGTDLDHPVGVADRLGDGRDRGERERAQAQVGPEHAARRHGHVLGEDAGGQRPGAESGHVAPGCGNRGSAAITARLELGQGSRRGPGDKSCCQAAHDAGRDVMREYSEEFLGNPEHDGDGDPIDYDNQEPFRSLNAARREGRIKVHYLGTGLDALNFVGDALTVAVFDAETFDDIFRDMVDINEEGAIAKDGKTLENYVFDDATIERLLATEAIAPSGAACLTLACQHRVAVLP